eukprot:TRINITY_DN27411_c0_g1_i1.p1 TRINITY_DN27411_c0_g1~~TRINITY_DN27411_c0_g1_i1.p1  ORF type:complete len:244 (+),score=83.08 TRINITY_DN27411_c0_g1_i1:76-807(+)
MESVVIQIGKLLWALTDLPIGPPKFVPLNWVINAMKLGTAPFVVLLMLYYNNFSVDAAVYLALHGSYGILWVAKDVMFGDPRWRHPVSLGGAVAAGLFLTLYWLPGYLLVSSPAYKPNAFLLFLALVSFNVGSFLMFSSDCQKYFTLRVRKGLITDGLFARTRNPNYLGEVLIYASFNIVSRHWQPWLVSAFAWGCMFYANMLQKDASISRYPEFAEYAKRSNMFFPKLSFGEAQKEVVKGSD